MAVTVAFHEFAKKENSTVRPIDSGTQLDCEFKQPFDLLSPVIILLADDFTPTGWNYAHIPVLNRYYYVTDWSYVQGRWFASTRVDALASWRTEIGNHTGYVLRSSADYDGNILDTAYPLKSRVNFLQLEGDIEWTPIVTQGSYVIGIINSDPNALGAISYYVFTQSEFNTLCGLLLNQADWLNINPDEISPELTKALFNPFQYITSCMWYPFTAPLGAAIKKLKFGWWEFNVSCHVLSKQPTKVFSVNIPKPVHPETVRGNYVNLPPFTRLTLFVPPWGDIPLDATIFINSVNVACGLYIDCISGIGGLRILATSAREGYSVSDNGYRTTQVGVPIQLAQMAVDYLGTASAAVSSIGNVVSSVARLDVPGVISSVVSGIESAANAMMPQLSTSGSNGSVMAYTFKPHVRAQFMDIVDEDNANNGRPLCKIRTISEIPGYVLLRDGHFSAACTEQERNTINNALIGGMYYE